MGKILLAYSGKGQIMSKITEKIICSILVLSMMLLCACTTSDTGTSDINDSVSEESLSHEGYTLDQVVILSRHNIRSPLSGGDSLLGTITPHEWFEWSSAPSELSIRGGTSETAMGQYFRQWLEREGFFPENYHPTDEEVRIYANSKQRTIATAKFFSTGLLPTDDNGVEYHMEFDQMDPVFTPQLTFDSDKYSEAAETQIRDMYTDDIKSLSDNYELLSDVIDMEDSKAVKDGDVQSFSTDDTEFILEEGAEPGMSGSLKTACSVSDAMVLQYYEESDEKKAAFGNNLSEKQWEDIAEIKDMYGDVLFTAPLVAANVAHPLLQEIASELENNDRKLTFLCGHDSNVGSVLAALGAEEYELPDTIEKKTPIGCKLVFTEYTGSDGEKYMSVDLVYQTTEQLRNMRPLDQEYHPDIYPVSFDGLYRNEDGLFLEKELKSRISDAINEYDEIKSLYGEN